MLCLATQSEMVSIDLDTKGLHIKIRKPESVLMLLTGLVSIQSIIQQLMGVFLMSVEGGLE